ESCEVFRRDPALHDIADLSRLGLVSLDGDSPIRTRTRDRRGSADCRRTNSRNRLQSLQQFLIRERQTFVAISTSFRIESHQQDMVRVETQIEMAEIQQVTDEQASCAQQHNRQSYLGGH